MKLEALFTESRKTGVFTSDFLIRYISERIGKKFVKYPAVEHFKNSHHTGYGERYYSTDAAISLRLNWDTAKLGNLDTLRSIDVFYKNQNPTICISVTKIGFLYALPEIVDLILTKAVGSFHYLPVDPRLAINEAVSHSVVLSEAKRGDYTLESCLSDFFQKVVAGKTFTRIEFIQTYHTINVGVFDAIWNNHKEDFSIIGKRIGAPFPGKSISELAEQILALQGTVLSVRAGVNDRMIVTKEDPHQLNLPEDDPMPPYEDSLKHLEALTKGLASPQSGINCLIITGRGGCLCENMEINVEGLEGFPS